MRTRSIEKQHVDRQSEVVPAQQRSTLLLARILCAVVVALSVWLFAATLPTYITYLNRPCVPASCIYGQLPVGSDQGLRGLGLSLSAYVVLNVTLVIITGLLCATVAVLLLWRKSDSWIAVLMAFLHGRFVPRWTRWLVMALMIAAIMLTIFPYFVTASTIVPTLSEIFFSIGALCLIGAQIYRYRRVSTPVEQQQTKWVIFGFSLLALIAVGLTIPESILAQSGQPYSSYMIVGLLAGSSIGIPVALCFGIAILRSHLYDIDVIINRTLVYGSLTAVLALIYAGSIIGLQFLVSIFTGHLSAASQSPLVLVVSTLVIAALFQPLRRRLQQIIDRRFYRRKYDAAHTLAAFSAMLRHEVDLGELHEQLLTVVEETMQPEHISLWLRPSIKTEDDSLY